MSLPFNISYSAEKVRKQRKTAQPFNISYFSISAEDHYKSRRAYTGVSLKKNSRPLNGVRLAINSSRVVGRSLGLRFELIEHTLDNTEDPVSQVQALLSQNNSQVAILDLPKAMMLEVAEALAGRQVVLFNARHRDNDLRGAQCQQQIYHTIPSHSMLMDALNQYLKNRSWTEVILLSGPNKDDTTLADAYKSSAAKFAIEVVAENAFVMGSDPRDRSKNNIALLTGRPTHDVIVVADALGEFARYVPYQSYHSRLVVGSEGLIPDAWHWTWERYGAPQLNQRFNKKYQSRMSAEEWAGWVAVRAIISAIRLARSAAPGNIIEALGSADLSLDLYKGGPGNFRPWNNQLRQPVLLRTHNAVIARAPLEGFLHQYNHLDTLGTDQLESGCAW